MYSVRRRFVLMPQGRLRLVAVPGIFLASTVAIEQRLVLELVPTKTPRESIFRPDDLAADLKAGRFQRVLKFPLPGGAVADV